MTTTGIAPDPKKVTAVREFAVPEDLKILRSFVGLASYYRRFIPSFSRIAAPLFELTKKDKPYRWTEECQTAFDRLKQLLTEAPVLAYPRFDTGFQLETDASRVGLGAVLAQRQEDGTVRPVAYASRTLLHEALKTLLNTPHPSGKLARWGLSLQELDLRIHYRPEPQNGNADALSRCPIGEPDDSAEDIRQVATLQPDVVTTKGGDPDLARRQRSDPLLAPLIEYHRNDTLPGEERAARQLVVEQQNFSLIDDILYRVMKDGSLRLVPPAGDHRELFREAHAGKFGGHLREHKLSSTMQSVLVERDAR